MEKDQNEENIYILLRSNTSYFLYSGELKRNPEVREPRHGQDSNLGTYYKDSENRDHLTEKFYVFMNFVGKG
jgi:hypothetical protein